MGKLSLTTATKLVQARRDLERTKQAEANTRIHRMYKNTPLQSGGVLTITQARQIVQQRKDTELAKAQRLVEAAEQKARNTTKRAFADATKIARK